MDKILFWKAVSKYSSITIVVMLIIKMLFRETYGDIGMFVTTGMGVLAVIGYFMSEIMLFTLKRKRS